MNRRVRTVVSLSLSALAILAGTAAWLQSQSSAVAAEDANAVKKTVVKKTKAPAAKEKPASEKAAADKPAPEKATTEKADSDPAVDRTRRVVQMLDGIYKHTIVLITDKYVHDEDDFAAGSAAVKLFADVSKGGSHQVRLIDVTGEPYEPDNVAKDAFEKAGVKEIKAGKDFYEEIVEEDGKRQLRAMTPVPVVLQKCIMCHAHYGDVKEGEAIGAIIYRIDIE